MKVFVTGATGFVGAAVVDELIRNGHKVVGLSRNPDKGRALAAQGAEVLSGTLEELDKLASAAVAADATIHCGFNHDFTRFAENCAQEGRVITAMAGAYKGTAKPLIVTSGVGVLPGQLVTEDIPVDPASHNPRKVTEITSNEMIAQGVDVRAVRLPIVHGDGDHGFIAMMINLAKEKGAVAYAGDGQNTWASVHRFDAAKAYRLALEKGASGARYHPVAEQGVTIKALADILAERLNLPQQSLTGDAIAAHFTWFAHFAQMNMKASSAKTRSELGWAPKEIGLIEDLKTSQHYFAG
ncbi:SDR family oxidoreductase [Aestuariivirga litoralis]|uniref:SDR family oxidoreductase n=1 Tax=Aestuariivirga litoralis TaxID=2650924 RepID=UPI0018C6AF33|nr:SDR family oxidoreductase [Aestuariivirga litoralis]MBG1231132.1 SDR family oxidoreductase [Aestuariivirga litoralis]